MFLDQNGGGMSVPDLRTLIESRIPEHRASLENCHMSLEDVAMHCNRSYLERPPHERNMAFEETKQYALQSLASVAYQINTLARDLLDMLELQTDKISTLTNQVVSVNMVVNIHKEKLARREIGVLTTNKNIVKQPKLITPATPEQYPKYKRIPIDYSVLDGVGHGVRIVEQPPRNTMVSRAASSISGVQTQYSQNAYQQYERTANINNTLSRSSMRSHMSMGPQSDHHYRVPQVVPMVDPQRYASNQSQHLSDNYSNNSLGTPTSIDYGSQHGSSEYGGGLDRYGTLRARPVADLRPESPGLPLPPPQPLTGHYGYAGLGIRESHADFPPPPAQMLNSSHDDPLPPPPGAGANFFDTRSDWVPEVYLERAIALYDYDANKPDELSLRENCIVYVLRKNDDGWYEGVLDGVTGLFPGNYVQPT